MTGIYKITSPEGEVYVGQSKNIKKRFWMYKKLYCKRQRALYESIKRYGFENHISEIVIELPSDVNRLVLGQYEDFVLEQFREGGIKLLNLKTGGIYGKHCEESRHLMADAAIGNKRWLGKKHTEQAKKKIADSKIGKKLSSSHIEKLRKSNLGKKYSLGFKHTLETRKKKWKPVIQIKDGVVLREFENSKSASSFFGLKSQTSIHNVLRGYRKNAAGFQWDYALNKNKYINL